MDLQNRTRPLNIQWPSNSFLFLIDFIGQQYFILGFSIGTNKLIMDNLKYFCEQAALIAGQSLLGSSVAALLVYQMFFKKGGEDYEG